jgi:hypothetical protein
MKKFAVIFGIILLIMACATGGVAVVEDKPVESERPSWTISFPAEDGFYVGIGTSNTGNESEDRKIAEDRARTGIAASISTKLHSETEIYSREDSEGDLYNYVEEEITAVVEQSLSGVETVDTFYSKDAGSWVYMKLSISLWEQIQQEEMAAIITRIKEFLNPSLNDFDRPLLTKLQELVKARNLILESPYAGMLKTSILGESGSFIDLIDSILKQHLDSIYLSINPENLEVETGQGAAFNISVASNKSSRIGNMPLAFISEDGKRIINALSNMDGSFESEIKSSDLAMGKNYITLVLEGEAIGINESLRFLSLPEKAVLVDVQTVSIGLEVISPEEVVLYGMDGTVKSLFSMRNLPFKIGSVETPLIQFDIRVSDFPKYLENAPDMAQASAVISLIRRGKTIYSYESEQFKDGGLTPEQAHDRAFAKLIEGLESNEEYVRGIVNALSLN